MINSADVDSLSDLKSIKSGLEPKRGGGFDWQNFLIKNKLSLGLGLIGIFFLGIGVLSAIILSAKPSDSSIEIIPAVSASPQASIYVHIAGAVQMPGLYQLTSDARVNDVLIACGGLSAEADREWFDSKVNLAQKVSDGIKIYIPSKDELAGINQQGQVAGEQTSIFVQENNSKININTASASELESLPGIGSVTAQKIIDYRTSNGLFAKIEDLTQVPGIGDKTLAEFKDQITVN